MKRITEKSFFGIPWFICMLLALGISVIYFFIWPSSSNDIGVFWFILRYFHSAVWILLSSASLIMLIKFKNKIRVASYLARLSLVLYIIFIIVFILFEIL